MKLAGMVSKGWGVAVLMQVSGSMTATCEQKWNWVLSAFGGHCSFALRSLVKVLTIEFRRTEQANGSIQRTSSCRPVLTLGYHAFPRFHVENSCAVKIVFPFPLYSSSPLAVSLIQFAVCSAGVGRFTRF